MSTLIASLTPFIVLVFRKLDGRYLRPKLIFFLSFTAGLLLSQVVITLLPALLNNRDHPLLLGAAIVSSICLLALGIFVQRAHYTDNLQLIVHFSGVILHNVIDGSVLVGAFMFSRRLGMVTLLYVMARRIMQQLGDFGVALHSNLKPRQALSYYLLTSFALALGAIVTYNSCTLLSIGQPFIVAYTITMFLYLAAHLIAYILLTPMLPARRATAFAFLSLGIVLYALL